MCYYFLSVATRKFKITHVGPYVFLVDGAALDSDPAVALFLST